MPTLRIDGRTVHAAEGATILEAARGADIEIPTLCHHEALEPWGGCRLCVVDVTRAEWDGWSKVVVSCMASADEGLIVDTVSERVVATRKVALDLLLARCPDTPLIGELAARHGIETTSYQPDPEPTDCILCGLCTRVCESYATSAIATWGRGTSKAVGTFNHQPPEDCVGCGACALVCPTGHIEHRRTERGYEIWDRRFEASVCQVDPGRCIACGRCEEACPFSVARIVVQAAGAQVATIPAEHCRGCGACVGACPSGAIEQAGLGFAELAAGLSERGGGAPRRVGVLACGRANLQAAALPPGVAVVEVPCTGRASSALLIAAMASGADGLLVLGRHQQTCRLQGAEDPAREATERAALALEMIGLGAERVVFVSPAPGPKGAVQAIERHAAAVERLGRSPVLVPPPADALIREDLDASLALLAWMGAQAGLAADGSSWRARTGLPAPAANRAVLHAGRLPWVDVLGGSAFGPLGLGDLLRAALDVLGHLGIVRVGVAVGDPAPGAASLEAELNQASAVIALSDQAAAELCSRGVQAQSLTALLTERAPDLALGTRRQTIACDGGEEARGLLSALGFGVADLGVDPLPQSWILGPAERAQAAEHLQRAERLGARAMLVCDPLAYARWRLLTRSGSWRSSRVRPLMAHQLVALAQADAAFAFHALESLSRREHQELVS